MGHETGVEASVGKAEGSAECRNKFKELILNKGIRNPIQDFS